jgi:hypothetical protein
MLKRFERANRKDKALLDLLHELRIDWPRGADVVSKLAEFLGERLGAVAGEQCVEPLVDVCLKQALLAYHDAHQRCLSDSARLRAFVRELLIVASIFLAEHRVLCGSRIEWDPHRGIALPLACPDDPIRCQRREEPDPWHSLYALLWDLAVDSVTQEIIVSASEADTDGEPGALH